MFACTYRVLKHANGAACPLCLSTHAILLYTPFSTEPGHNPSQSMLELMLLLARDVPAFGSRLIGLDWKFHVDAAETIIEQPPYRVLFHPNQV